MADVVFVQSASGVIFEMDVPTTVHARERFDAAIAKGDLALLDPSTVEKVEVPGGGYTWRAVAAVAEPADAGDVTGDADDPSDPPVADDVRASLISEAEALGVKVRSNWGAKRLQEEIDLAKAAQD